MKAYIEIVKMDVVDIVTTSGVIACCEGLVEDE